MKYFELFLNEAIHPLIREDLHPSIFYSIEFKHTLIFARCHYLNMLIQKSVMYRLDGIEHRFANSYSVPIWIEGSYFVSVHDTSFYLSAEQLKYIGVSGKEDVVIFQTTDEDEIFYYVTGSQYQEQIANTLKTYRRIYVKGIEEYNDDYNPIEKVEWHREK